MNDLYKPVDMKRLMELAGVKEADMDDPFIAARTGKKDIPNADFAKAAAEPLPPSKLTTTRGEPIASGTPGLNWNEQPKKVEPEPAPVAVTTPEPAPAPVAVTTPVPEPVRADPVNPNPAPEPKIDPTLVVEPPKTGPRREPAGTGAVVGRTRLPGVSATPPAGSLAARKAAEIATRAPDPYGKRVTPAPTPGGFQSLTPPAAPYFRPTPNATPGSNRIAPIPNATPGSNRIAPAVATNPARSSLSPMVQNAMPGATLRQQAGLPATISPTSSSSVSTNPANAPAPAPTIPSRIQQNAAALRARRPDLNTSTIRETSADLARMQNLAGIRKN